MKENGTAPFLYAYCFAAGPESLRTGRPLFTELVGACSF
ncbi:hypothetical protein SpiGrapes_3143 [Sphaerochaeta pleomorpha str. Grapes]|uniref:Uncharacterized protein n=1 Tax=Sphaerochaeta pleomorpha (strain ATCC BAA-1885 / DSM 22778 / Grapes) TaxID=158190 RepID=G8QZ30_SPHPG|nr:hypothetical protein SpiGrapes_3143 [Sphaerochaeta pleomorpha str. Grapes]